MGSSQSLGIPVALFAGLRTLEGRRNRRSLPPAVGRDDSARFALRATVLNLDREDSVESAAGIQSEGEDCGVCKLNALSGCAQAAGDNETWGRRA